ncbi:MAG: hypothetical protein LBL01_01740 [Bifidobacteriaceae bacterium]|jgi:hypothetical protein|nr:hypothetical protein [Bifidobacteriaceae bacterium]
MRRRSRGGVGLAASALCVFSSAAVAGCAVWPARPEPRDVRTEITEAIQAAVGAEVAEFWLPDPPGEPDARIVLAPAEGQGQVSSEDVVNVIAAVDSLMPEHRALRRGSVVALYVRSSSQDQLALARWDKPEGGGDPTLTEISSAAIAYGGYFCGLPRTLERFWGAGPGSDFARAAECSPALESLEIAAWDQSAGHGGLAGLDNLKALYIGGIVDDVRELPALPGLEELSLPEAADTPENRAFLERSYPHAELTFWG